jgi:hypothetical protein
MTKTPAIPPPEKSPFKAPAGQPTSPRQPTGLPKPQTLPLTPAAEEAFKRMGELRKRGLP